jgi:hypothetical protein
MRNALLGMRVAACSFASGQAVGAERSAKIVDENPIFALCSCPGGQCYWLDLRGALGYTHELRN